MSEEYYICVSCGSDAPVVRGEGFAPYYRCIEGECRDLGKIDENKVQEVQPERITHEKP